MFLYGIPLVITFYSFLMHGHCIVYVHALSLFRTEYQEQDEKTVNVPQTVRNMYTVYCILYIICYIILYYFF